jgi:hypothetical protein
VRREFGRADQVTEHHGQLPALGIGGSRCISRCCHDRSARQYGTERSDCGEELTAMADRGHADADQVLGRQRRQHLSIDIIVAECRCVLFEPQPAQPRHYVHAVILGCEERQPLMGEDIPLILGVPAAALKRAPCRVSRLQAVNDRFQAWATHSGQTGRVALPHKAGRSIALHRRSGVGQEEPFPGRRLSGRLGWISAVPDRCGFHCPSADSGRSHLTTRP